MKTILVGATAAFVGEQMLAQSVHTATFAKRGLAAFAPRDANGGDEDGGEPEATVRGTFGVDVPTAYYFRGIRFEDQGFLAQPFYELTYGLHEAEQGLRNVELVLGTWNSFHTGPTGLAGGASSWYEADGYLGLSSQLDERCTVSGTYSFYSSPNGAFGVSEELILGFAFDDAKVWGEASGGLQPAFTLGIETKGQQDGGAKRGIYAQLAIEPSFAVGSAGDAAVTLALPVAIGCSLADYYEDTTGKDRAFGFVDIGAVLSSPLTFVPSRLGPWTATLSLHALLLGETPEEANGGDAFQWIAAFGLSTTF